ncbi:MAG: hypothetical protein R3A48_09415 [Polyangiales bacterium]
MTPPRRPCWLPVAGLCVVACAHAPRSAPSRTAFEARVTLSRDRRALDVSMCFSGAAPMTLVGSDLDAVTLSPPARVRGRAVETDARGCVRYRFDLEGAGAWPRRRVARGDAAVVISNRAWLLRPQDRREVRGGEISLALPPGVRAVVPWRPLGADRYAVDASLFAWEGYLALAARDPVTVTTPLARFEVARVEEGRSDPRPWLAAAASAVLPLAGGESLGRAQVILDGRGIEPRAPPGFGLSSRGGGRSLLFVVGRDADGASISGEWIAVHEMVHMLLPVTRDDDAWLGEGIATYYQEVLRARAGMITPHDAWANLCSGLAAGARAAGRRTLAEVARGRGEYTRLYWSGAAVALRADVALRRRGSSLDEAVRRWRGCCVDAPRTWSAMELVELADRAAGERVLAPIAEEALASRELPGVREALASLGVAPDGAMIDGPLRAMRDAITAPSPGSPVAPAASRAAPRSSR